MLQFILLQASTPITETATPTLNLFDLALKGGWIMLPILVLSIVAIFIFIDRYQAVKKASKIDYNLLDEVKILLEQGKKQEALKLVSQENSPIARMIEKGINNIDRSMTEINNAIEMVGNLEISKLEKGLPVLASVAGGAPMIGFLGTVMGMIQAFYDMASAGSNIDVTLLSSGIYQAMVTTAAGLIVGIVAYFAYNIMVSNVEKVVFKMEAATSDFLDLLNNTTKA
ncbi:MAG: MotA/TolQ/ExbB proton channel family protein [Mangrovibacterium sp.]